MIYRFEINSEYDALIGKLDKIVESNRENENLGFDIYLDDKSEAKLRKINITDYSLAFTRPAFNASVLNAFDLILFFTVKKLENKVSIIGKIKLKVFIFVFLVLFLGVYLTLLFIAPEFDIMTILFFAIAPIYLLIYFLKQRKRFRNRANLFFHNLVIQK